MYSTVTVVNTALYIWKLLRVDLTSSHHKKKNFVNMYVCGEH